MPQISSYADGASARFAVPLHNKQATATVDGSAATISSQGDFSVTLASAPAAGAKVVITFTAVTPVKPGVTLLAQSATAVSVTGTLTETVFAAIPLLARTIGENGMLRVTMLWSYTNSANSKTLRTKLGGTSFFTSQPTTTVAARVVLELRNRNSLTSQVSFNATTTLALGTSGAANATYSIDLSVDQTLQITAQLAATGEVITLEGYTVEAVNP